MTNRYALHLILLSGDIDRAASLYASMGWGASAACQIRGACNDWGIDPMRFGCRP